MAHEWSSVRRFLSPCEKTPSKQDKHLVTSVSPEQLRQRTLIEQWGEWNTSRDRHHVWCCEERRPLATVWRNRLITCNFLCITLAVLCRKIMEKTGESGAPSRRKWWVILPKRRGRPQEMGILLYELQTKKLAGYWLLDAGHETLT